MHAISENIIQSGKPSKSAQKVAILRAVHQLLDEPVIFFDPIALPILGHQLEAETRNNPFIHNDPMTRSFRASLVARSMAAEDELKRAIQQAGVRQYVVLGAGLDTFGFRNPYADAGLRVFEVDHPSTQHWKKLALQQAGIDIPGSLSFVAVDFERDALADKLREADFRADLPTCFSWLGVTVYLTREAIFETLKFVASLPKGSSITFDYRIDSTLLDPDERMIGEHIWNLVAQTGEPWKSVFKPPSLQQELRAIGFQRVENMSPDQINAHYFHGRADGLRTNHGVHLMRAQT